MLQASLFITVSALGRALQQLVLQASLRSPLSLAIIPGTSQHATVQQQLADCLHAIFAACIQLRELSLVNEAAAQELSKQPTCLELVSA